jgi:hypothetical protein
MGRLVRTRKKQEKKRFMAGEVAQVSAILTQLQPEAQLSARHTLWASIHSHTAALMAS